MQIREWSQQILSAINKLDEMDNPVSTFYLNSDVNHTYMN
jgi:hypothetical protein